MILQEIVDAIGTEPYHQEEAGVIYCADCLDILPKIPDEGIDLVWTDPPYGHNNNNNNDMIANWEAIFGGKDKPRKVDRAEYRPIVNDGPEANDLFQTSCQNIAVFWLPDVVAAAAAAAAVQTRNLLDGLCGLMRLFHSR